MLETVWFGVWALLWAVYFALDGFDLGAGALLPLVAKSGDEKARVYSAVGPFWDGNEVWLVAAGGVTFAAFPGTYAVMFSVMYSPLLLVLFALIFRGAALGLRGESEGSRLKRTWDLAFTISSIFASLLFGIAFANIFRGVPFDREGIYHGNLFGFLNPYALLGGALFLAAFGFHGCLWLALKCDGEVERRARSLAGKLWLVLVVLSFLFLLGSAISTEVWKGYLKRPFLLPVPLVMVAALFLSRELLREGREALAWGASGVFIMGLMFFGLFGIYPAMFPSTLDPEATVTVSSAASSPLTLKIMLGVILVFVPLIVFYQSWVYRVFKGKVEVGGYGY